MSFRIATSEYEEYLRQLNEMAGRRIGRVGEEGVRAATQDIKEAMHSMVRTQSPVMFVLCIQSKCCVQQRKPLAFVAQTQRRCELSFRM